MSRRAAAGYPVSGQRETAKGGPAHRVEISHFQNLREASRTDSEESATDSEGNKQICTPPVISKCSRANIKNRCQTSRK